LVNEVNLDQIDPVPNNYHLLGTLDE
jgi:hypothetical protein